MIFSSFTFLLLFMPCVLLLYRVLPAGVRMPFLLAASLLFYGWGNPAWLLLIFFSMVLNWGGVLLMTRGGKKPSKAALAGMIVLNLLPLLWFKYAGFLADTWTRLTGIPLDFTAPGLPAGISFFTFQAMSYVIDVYRGQAKPQKNFVTFSVYLSLFPQLVAGPIVRYTDLEAQLIARPKPEYPEMREGLRRFCTGLAKKVLLADAMGRLWGSINGNFAVAGALGAWVGLLAFSFQIFFDFSGYSDMAIGLCRCMGFRIPENFDRPYRARSLTDFWRRWHMTLTDWFRAYVYIPLGGSRRGRIRRDLNVLVVWALTGLWHGAGWNFVLWGLYFALLLIFEKRSLLKNRIWLKIPGWIRQLLTFLAVMLGWGLFSGFGSELWKALWGGYGGASAETVTRCAAYAPLLLLCAAVSFLPAPKNIPLRRFAAPVLMFLCLAALAAQGYAPFVYFQF
ncbi:MAG: MBOAT family protein [Clostridia bacterium]|nr:MBOAT family protein [Clostridia bacterium]